MQKILVLGAGELGLAILKALSVHEARSHASITLLLRPSSTAREELEQTCKDLDVQIVYRDLSSSVSELAVVFNDYNTVVSATGFAAGPKTQLRIAQAVLESKATWFIPWQFGVDYDVLGRGSSQPLFDEQLDVRDLLRGQRRLQWTIISTGLFTSFLFEPAFGVVDLKKGIVRALGKWENRITVTSAEDIGRITAEVVLGEEQPKDVIFVAADTVTFTSVAQAVQEVRWDIRREVVTVAELEEQLREDSNNVMVRYQLIWARNRGVAWEKEGTWNHRNGLQTESLREWVQANLLARYLSSCQLGCLCLLRYGNNDSETRSKA